MAMAGHEHGYVTRSGRVVKPNIKPSLGTLVTNNVREGDVISRDLKGHYHDVAHARTVLASFIGKQWNCHFVASCGPDKVTVERYLYPIRHSRSSLTVQGERLTRSTSQGKRLVFSC